MGRAGALALIAVLLGLSVAGVGALIVTVDEPADSAATAGLEGDPPSLGLETCAAEVPSDHADPSSDELGWYDGIWYDEAIEVDQSDGLDEDELEDVVARTIARWEALRCLSVEEEVPIEVIDRETFQEEQRETEFDNETRTWENVANRALFLVDETEDAVELQLENRGESVLGYYDIAEAEIVLVSGDGGDVYVDESSLAHEIGHAVQAQHFGFDDWGEETTDARLAELGLVEGDASFTQRIYEQHCEDGAWSGACLEPPSESTPSLAHEGLYLLSIYPYSDGAAFVKALYERDGWSTVDAAFDDYPPSAKAVTYPERYPEFEPEVPPLEDRSNDDWTLLESSQGRTADRLGEPAWFTAFAYTALNDDVPDVISRFALANQGEDAQMDPYEYSHPYTDGWVGDRFLAYTPAGPEADTRGPGAYAGAIAFEDADEAATFLEGYGELLAAHGGEAHPELTAPDGGLYRIDEGEPYAGAYWFARDGATVRLVHAPSVDELTAVNDDVAVVEATPTPTPTATSTATAAPSPTATDTTTPEGQPGPGLGLAAVVLALA
ncbi:MAG: Hvo_1808 family surface protein, partial [Halobacteriota archaeon]